MAKLIISRKNEFMNWASEYKIYLNGQKIKTISSGETIEIDVPEGTSIIKAKINWLSGSHDLPVSFRNEDLKVISISGLKLPNIIVGLMSLLTILMIVFRIQIKTDFPFLKLPIAIIASFFIIASLYYLTLGRNKYIEIKENPKQTE